MITFGILGCGRIGRVHAASLAQTDGARIGAVSDAFDSAAQALSQVTGAPARTTDEIIADPAIDAIIIGTPTDTHFDIIHAAARAGKAIFCEKPVDMSADRIRACIAVVEAAGVPFMTAFNRRFETNFAQVRQQIADGAIGPVEIVTIQSRDPAPPPIGYIQSSGGLFRDMMIHDLDMARFLLDEEPVQVFAVGSALVDPAIGAAGDVDTAAVTLTTASGRICQITNSRRATYGYDQRVEVHGARGMLRAENVLEHSVELATEAGFRRAPTLNFFLERYAGAYRAELAHFVAALTAGTVPSPSIHDGLRAQLLADAAAESLATGQPVQLA
ncbi:inositol 2-dehydrogenase [Jannaschia sp. M317]|uniref:inositol 2-dehydrogenase n=1 Tax=Jannaschia sp. M317 TaxID=2867011 RepID=UPI0021A63BD8|nr:inositol 2-dehydrogenase [Jannaschia sp. M317]UWQ18193.1 inositol 2-dehydrogenase [Jannaschia sp. M317]